MEILFAVAAVVAAALSGFALGRRRDRPRTAPMTGVEPVPAPEPRPLVVAGPASPPLSVGPVYRDIERALADLRLGVVVLGTDGREIYRNNRAKEFAKGRHGDALVEAALQRVVEAALLGLSLEESVEVYGPPARSFLIQASPTYEGGQLGGAVAVVDDVTETRHILRVRSDFVANVSHELRTPVGALSVLAETIAGADDPEVIERLSGRMLREATRLANTIDDLLALSRLESGPVGDPATIDLVSVALMAIERSAEAAAQRHVGVVMTDDTVGPVLIDGDQGQLVSAVANLVDNAVKYSDAEGRVEVQVRAIEAGESTQPGQRSSARLDRRAREHRPAPDLGGRWPAGTMIAELSVSDDGIGIPARDLERIFERFYRVDSGRSRETGGTGLGLSIVRHALLNHRGTIDVESLEGQGSTFTVRLPLSASQAQVAPGNGPLAHNNEGDRP